MDFLSHVELMERNERFYGSEEMACTAPGDGFALASLSPMTFLWGATPPAACYIQEDNDVKGSEIACTQLLAQASNIQVRALSL